MTGTKRFATQGERSDNAADAQYDIKIGDTLRGVAPIVQPIRPDIVEHELQHICPRAIGHVGVGYTIASGPLRSNFCKEMHIADQGRIPDKAKVQYPASCPEVYIGLRCTYDAYL